MVGSNKVVGSSNKQFYAQMVSIQAVLSFKYPKIYVAKSMASLTSQSCGNSLPQVSSCPGKMGPFIDHPSIFGRQTG